MENQEQVTKQVPLTKAQIQHQENMRKQSIQREKEQLDSMHKRRDYLQCLVDIRELEEKAFGQDSLMNSVKRDSSIFALRSVEVREEDILLYLIKNKLSTENDEKIYSDLQKAKEDSKKPVMKVSKNKAEVEPELKEGE